MIENYNLLLTLFLITWFFTNHDKITPLIDRLYICLDIKFKNKILKFIFSNLHEILTCHKCLSFWTTLIVTQNFIDALLVSFIAYLTQKKDF